MRMLNILAILALMASAAQADQKLPLFGSEASGVLKISSKTQQQASLETQIQCLAATCPTTPKADIRPNTQGKQP